MKICVLAFLGICAFTLGCKTEGEDQSNKNEKCLKEEERPVHTLSWGIGPAVKVGFAGNTYEYFLNGKSIGIGDDALAKAFDFLVSSEPCTVRLLCRNHQFRGHRPFDDSQTIGLMSWYFWNRNISILLVYERSENSLLGVPDGENPFRMPREGGPPK